MLTTLLTLLIASGIFTFIAYVELAIWREQYNKTPIGVHWRKYRRWMNRSTWLTVVTATLFVLTMVTVLFTELPPTTILLTL